MAASGFNDAKSALEICSGSRMMDAALARLAQKTRNRE
jgi:hypothetical protein